ncbi:hypothetical protein [Spirosoma sordidisoli]|uniref:Uncharacterized protein n=1 Tax=Spirosoma sordidisoli TaxID=2502893 RepID=A0A4Q2UBM8_9BACT|nr:hypothetical protein [Spirosoma sordidisoli]RYC66347.1 hypothetical protein EQG79_30200 [Spirosoma sordidisoli]
MLDLQRDVLPYLRRDGAPAGKTPSPPGTALIHEYYARSVAHKKELRSVFGDAYPEYLDINRPKERPTHKKYRKEVYRNPFRSYPGRVKNALDYIKQADDFEIQFPTVADGTLDRFEQYVGRTFSPSGSAVNWFFTEAVQAYLDDPNAVMLTLPEQGPLSDREYPEPRFHLIPSENVWMHRKGRFAVLCSPRRNRVIMPDGQAKNDGLVVFFVDHDSYTVARQVARIESTTGRGHLQYEWQILGLSKWAFDPLHPELGVFPWEGPAPAGWQTWEEFDPPRHYCQAMPAHKLGKKRLDHNADGEELYESLLADAIPHVKDGQQAKSDMQIEFNFHVSSQEWRRTVKRCTNAKCSGGQVMVIKEPGQPATSETCPVCKGTSVDISGSGLDILWVSDGDSSSMSVGNAGLRMPPGAPGGFIPRPIEALQELIKELNRCMHEAFTTINMQFIRETPQEVSGASKAKDREEMYRELNNQGDHLLTLFQLGLEYLDAIRYGRAGRAGLQVPVVMVPVRYNLENAELIRQELNEAKLNKYDSTIIEALEKKMLEYTTGKRSEQFRRYELRTRLDPFRDMIDEIKFYTLGIQYMLYQEGPEQIEAIERMWLSINFDGLVSDCVLDVPDFWERNLVEQRELLRERNRNLIGKLTEKGVNGDMFPKLEPMTFNPPVDLQQTAQTPDSFVNPK